MMGNELWLVYALVFGAVLLAVQSLYALLFRERQNKAAINRRLILSVEHNNPAEVLNILRRERGLDILSNVLPLRGLKSLLVQSAVRVSVFTLLFAFCILAALFGTLVFIPIGSLLVAVGVAMVMAAACIYGWLNIARSRRIARFGEQLPDALDIIVRGLRAGHPFRVSLALVAREMPDPVGTEFGIVADEIMFGLEQSVAVDNIYARVGQRDLLFLSTAINVQHQTGGNLAEILTRLSRLLRSRSKLRLKIRALSSEGRLSAIVLSLAPFILFGVVSMMMPDYFSAVRNHPIVPPVIGLGALLLIIGNFVMYRMVNFKF
ncbi:type II secretion system F family protein [Bradyrhizobium erythrophlei]|uniref:type II secretion system F family protein n=1 Tax=Bradyrhizobium erythrophlei TaxID=1437360 RepID=UPI0035EDB4C8